MKSVLFSEQIVLAGRRGNRAILDGTLRGSGEVVRRDRDRRPTQRQPNAVRFRRHGTEICHGVRVRRVWHTRFPKRFLPGRLINYLSFLIGALWAALWTKRPDIVVVETDPPLLCLIGWCLQRDPRREVDLLSPGYPSRYRHRPGKTPRWLVVRKCCGGCCFMSTAARTAWSSSVATCAITSRSRALTPGESSASPTGSTPRRSIPLKAENPFRQRHGANGPFVVMYSGNLGFCQRLEDVISAAHVLRDRSDILFLLVGGGSLQRQLQDQVAGLGLRNVRFIPHQPITELAGSLSAADVHLVPLDERIASCLMPSKLYGVLASATPLIAIAPENCELAELTLRYGVGVLTPPGRPQALAEVIENFADDSRTLPEMGKRARRLAESCYDRGYVVPQFHALLQDVLGITSGTSSLRVCDRREESVSASVGKEGRIFQG